MASAAERSPRRRPTTSALAYLTGLAKLYIPANLPICLACGRDYPWLCIAQAALGVYLGTITVNGNAPKPSSYDRAAEQRALAKLVTTSPRNRTVRAAMGSCNLLAAVLYAARGAKEARNKPPDRALEQPEPRNQTNKPLTKTTWTWKANSPQWRTSTKTCIR